MALLLLRLLEYAPACVTTIQVGAGGGHCVAWAFTGALVALPI